MSKSPDLSAFPIPRKGAARPIGLDGAAEMPERAGGLAVGSMSAAPEQAAAPPASGQIVATTVKLDENRYLRLADAGRPGPGRLKRRSIQEIMVEALDEWFERRGI